MAKPGRNDPCACGSGRKFKHCCERRQTPAVDAAALLRQAIADHQGGRLQAAEALYRRILEHRPEHADALHLLGVLVHQRGDADAAIELVRRAIAIAPGAAMFGNLGNMLRRRGDLAAAVEHFKRALGLAPDDLQARYNLAVVHRHHAEVLRDSGAIAEAITAYEQAIGLDPGAEACNDLGTLLQRRGRLDAAIERYRQALALQPGLAAIHNNLGTALQARGELAPAEASYRQALALHPDYAEAHNHLGSVLRARGQLAQAIACHTRALELRPDDAEAWNHLGIAEQDRGHPAMAIECYRRALALRPDHPQTRSNLLFAMNFDGRSTPAECLAEARRYGESVATRATPYRRWGVDAQDAEQGPLRVGFVSGDLRQHPVGYFLAAVVEALNPARVALFAYSTNPRRDELSTAIGARFAGWRELSGLDDAAAAAIIHADGLHLLVDLAGHTAHNRLPLFAWRPAPVQATWLGYFATTGVAAIDALLADEVSAPAAIAGDFTETIIRLPQTRLCFTPPADAPPESPLPAAARGYPTFACFQKLAKLNDQVLSAWGRIFAALPSARLALQCWEADCPEVRRELLARLAAVGISGGRLTLAGPTPRADYLAAHAGVDLILDTFPYPGGTTTCEALWMGVPTLALAGATLLARQGASLMAAAGLAEWVADDIDDYVARAIAAVADLDRLAALRAGLRVQVAASPLFDAARFAGNLETACWTLWRQRDHAAIVRPE